MSLPLKQARANKMSFGIIRRDSQTFLGATRRFIELMAPFQEHRQFQPRIRDVPVQGEGPTKAFQRFFGTINHAVALGGEMEQSGVSSSQIAQSIQQNLCSSNFKPGS
jgi:hypothetical protein